MPDRSTIIAVAELLETIAAVLRVWAGTIPELLTSLRDLASRKQPTRDPDTFYFDGAHLHWGKESYPATSGPFGKGALPVGEYDVDWVHCAENQGPAYRIGDTSFWIPIKPRFKTDRGGFGIHPDGGAEGTKGCVGMAPAGVHAFWRRVKATAMSRRPERLTVSAE